MHKYQEALDDLVKVSCVKKVSCAECDINKICNSTAKEYVDTLQQLVDKATPKKPLKHPSYKFSFIDNIFKQQKLYICPTCRNACLVRIAPNERNENRYCYDCGQAIDWSGEE